MKYCRFVGVVYMYTTLFSAGLDVDIYSNVDYNWLGSLLCISFRRLNTLVNLLISTFYLLPATKSIPLLWSWWWLQVGSLVEVMKILFCPRKIGFLIALILGPRTVNQLCWYWANIWSETVIHKLQYR